MPSKKTKKTKTPSGAKYIKQKKLVKEISKKQPLNTLRFEESYFDVMRNRWLIDKYILSNGLFDSDLYENTLKAYKDCVAKKHATTITVQLTADNQVIVYKENTLARLNGNGYVANTNFDDIAKLSYVGTEDEKVATLSQVLDLIGGKVPVVIEVINTNSSLHTTEEHVLPLVEDYMTKHNLNEGVAVMSINPFCLQWFAEHAPHLPRILKSGKFKVKYYGNMKTRELKKLKYHTEAQADYVAYSANNLPTRAIKKVHPVGVIAYKVFSQNEYKKVAKYCDNIIYSGFEPII